MELEGGEWLAVAPNVFRNHRIFSVRHTANACPYLAHRRLSLAVAPQCWTSCLSPFLLPPSAHSRRLGLPGCRSATSHVLVTLSSFLSNDREASVHVVCPQTRHHPLSVLLRPHHIALVISSFFFFFFSHSLLFFIKQQGSIDVRLKCASSHGRGNHGLRWNGGKLCEQTPRFCFRGVCLAAVCQI